MTNQQITEATREALREFRADHPELNGVALDVTEAAAVKKFRDHCDMIADKCAALLAAKQITRERIHAESVKHCRLLLAVSMADTIAAIAN
jgi:hypothetical protein